MDSTHGPGWQCWLKFFGNNSGSGDKLGNNYSVIQGLLVRDGLVGCKHIL